MTKPGKIFIEKRKEENDFAIRKPGSERASKVEQTQQEAIQEAKKMFPDATILVERVKQTGKGMPHKWREA